MPAKKFRHCWGVPPWTISFRPRNRNGELPRAADFVIIGAGFTGLAAAAWLRRVAPRQSVVVLEADHVGAGASGRTGGMALSESAAGKLTGLRDVLGSLRRNLEALEIDCDLDLRGAWEISRNEEEGLGKLCGLIEWQDSGTLRVVNKVPGGALDPGKLVGGLGRAADRAGAMIFEKHSVIEVKWRATPEIEVASGSRQTARISAGRIVFATNALSLGSAGLRKGMHPRLTLAVMTEPVSEKLLEAVGLASRHPFYTLDMPYLWGRVRKDRSMIWGAGLVASHDSHDLEDVNVANTEPARIFSQLEARVRNLHPALRKIQFTRRWGGPILFRDSRKPVFDWHPRSGREKNAIVAAAYAGHGVALSSFLGKWAAEVLTGNRKDMPAWGRIDK